MKPTNTYQHLRVSYITLYYKHSKPATCTCFGQSSGHPQGGATQRIHYTRYGGTDEKHSPFKEKNVGKIRTIEEESLTRQ
jgi:hypothetical protein